MQLVFVCLHIVQIVVAIITTGLAGGMKADIDAFVSVNEGYLDLGTSSVINFFIWSAVSSFILAIIMLCWRLARSAYAATIATTILSAVWTIFWLAAIAALAAKVGVFGSCGCDEDSTCSTACQVSKAAWAFGFISMILWLVGLVCGAVDLCRGSSRAKAVSTPAPTVQVAQRHIPTAQV